MNFNVCIMILGTTEIKSNRGIEYNQRYRSFHRSGEFKKSRFRSNQDDNKYYFIEHFESINYVLEFQQNIEKNVNRQRIFITKILKLTRVRNN